LRLRLCEPTSQLVGYWNFDKDRLNGHRFIGNNNTGVLTTTTWTTGKLNGGLSFDGIDDYVEINHSASLNITRELTVSAWVYNKQNTNHSAGLRVPIIATKGAPDAGGSWTLGWDKKTNALFFC